jgi:flagellar protein FlbD
MFPISDGQRELRHGLSIADIAQGNFIGVKSMIVLTKINDASIAVNCDLIEYIEETPDTVITFNNSDRIVVQERMGEIIEKIVRYRRLISGLVAAECDRKIREDQ